MEHIEKKNFSVDFVLAMASRGGVENVLNQVCGYLHERGVKVRVIQILDTHVSWLESDVEFLPLTDREHIFRLDEMKPAYRDFMSGQRVADVTVCVGWPLVTRIVGEVFAELGIKSKIVSYLHGSIHHYAKDGVGGIDELRFADVHFCINQNNAAKLEKEYPESKVVRILNPIPMNRPRYSENRNPYELVYIGRFSEEKNPMLIIKALSMAPLEFTLKLFGEGALEDEMREIVHALDLEGRVEFFGWEENPWTKLENAGFLILSSRFEGFPLSVVEALLSGMPVISTPVNGVVDIVTPGANGYLYSQENPEELASILQMIFQNVLPVPNAKACYHSAEGYLSEYALSDFEEKLFKAAEKAE